MLVLPDEAVLGLGQDALHGLQIEGLEVGDDGQTADQFGDHPEAADVEVGDVLQQIAVLDAVLVLTAEADHLGVHPPGDNLLDAVKSATADEEDVLGIDLDEFLLRVLAAALGWNEDIRPLQHFQHGLLDPLAGDVPRNAGVVRLTGYFIDLVDVDDTALSGFHVIITDLQKAAEDTLHVFPYVAGLGEHRSVHDGEGHVEELCDGFGQEGLPRSRAADEQQVTFLDAHLVFRGGRVAEALVVVVNGDGKDLLRLVLADNVLVQVILDVPGRHALRQRELLSAGLGLGSSLLGRVTAVEFFVDDLQGLVGANLTDVGVQPGDQDERFALAPPAERTVYFLSFASHHSLSRCVHCVGDIPTEGATR